MKKILVVGGCGYVGGNIVNLLLKYRKKFQVTVLDSLLYEEQYFKNCNFINCDIRDKHKLKSIISKYDVVIWLAAIVGDGACNINPAVTKEINLDSIKFLKKIFNKRIIFFSTCSVYGAQDGLLDENSKTNPLSIYAKTKLEAEKILDGTNSVIFRLGTLFGLSDQFSRTRMDLVVNTLCAKAFSEKRMEVFGGAQYRPLLHVKDAARAVIFALNSNKKGIFNLCYKNMKIIDIAKKIKNNFKNTKLKKIKAQFQDTRNYQVSDAKVRKILGFKAIYSVDYGISELKKILESKRIKDLNNPRYTNQKYLEVFSKK